MALFEKKYRFTHLGNSKDSLIIWELCNKSDLGSTNFVLDLQKVQGYIFTKLLFFSDYNEDLILDLIIYAR